MQNCTSVLLAVACVASTAAAQDAIVVPGGDGLVGTWRVLGRDAAVDAAIGAFESGAQFAAESPVILVSAEEDGVVSLSPPLPSRPARPPHAPVAPAPPIAHRIALAARLDVAHATRIHLFVGVAGEVQVRLDGHPVIVHASPSHRSDDAVAHLELPPGRHALVLAITNAGIAADAPWETSTRVLDAAFEPGPGAGVVLVAGALDTATRERVIGQAAHVRQVTAVDDAGTGLDSIATVSWPAGALAGELSARGTGIGRIVDEGSLNSESHGDEPLRFHVSAGGLVVFGLQDASHVEIGARTIPLGDLLAADRPVARAVIALRRSLAQVSDAARAPVEWRIDALERIMAEHDPDLAWRHTLITDAQQVTRQLGRGQDPFAHLHGYVRMALRSRLDGTLVPYELFVPPVPRTGAMPLVVTLHGFTGNAGDYFRDTLELPRPPGQTLLDHGRNGVIPETTHPPMIVVAPTGRGQTHYRYAGEADVLEVLADVRARLPVDAARIYVTGGSMGGTGAAYLPFHHPDLFAASVALAGYHDQRVRLDTNHAALAPWERFLEAERSDVDWAENALHLPMLLVRGTQDRPTEWTSRLVDRLLALHYDVEHREPESGHNVWNDTYAGGALYRWLSPHRRPADPAHVRFRTARERFTGAWWITDVRRDAPDVFADVDATRAADGSVTATTTHVAAMTLGPTALGTPFSLRIDGDAVASRSGARIVRGAGGHWDIERGVTATAPAPPLARPIRDVYSEPLVIVYGDHATPLEIAAAYFWARPQGWQVSYPVIPEGALTDAMRSGHVVVLVGTPRTNGLLARLAPGLPIRVDEHGVTMGGTHTTSDEAGAVFVAADPDDATRTLLMVEAPTPLGVWRSTFLPDLLPDYVIYDEHIALARGRFAAGGTGAAFIAAGWWAE